MDLENRVEYSGEKGISEKWHSMHNDTEAKGNIVTSMNV